VATNRKAPVSSPGLPGATLFWLGFIGILGPMAIDIYLPALPAMANDFGTTAATVQLGLATTTIGMALGNIVVGAMSDRFGRRAPLLITGLLMVVGASLAAASFHIVWFLACCLIMGISASAVQVAGRGVIADLTTGMASTRAYSFFTGIIMAGPVFAPVGGVLILSFAGWRGIFVALAVFALIATIGVWAFVPESLSKEKRHSDGFVASLRGMGAIWRNRVYRWFAIVNFAAYALMFTYLGTCSLTIQVELGQPPWVAAAAFAANGAGIGLAGVFSGWLAKRTSSLAILFVSIAGQVAGIIVLAVVVATNSLSIVSIFAIYFVICTTLGISFGPVITLALTHVRKKSGTALGLLGLVQFIIAAITSVFVGTINPSPATAMLMIGGTVVAVSVIAGFGGRRALRRDPDPATAH
jgi:DHA1 family bicyclomycin/chloramphenicol resistance-like MFS transporter